MAQFNRYILGTNGYLQYILSCGFITLSPLAALVRETRTRAVDTYQGCKYTCSVNFLSGSIL